MKPVVIITCVLLLISCEYNDMYDGNDLPIREIHTSLLTGETIGVNTLTYNGDKLISEHFDANPQFARMREVIYEYDFEGNLTRKKERNEEGELFQIFEMTYKDGLKVSDKQYQESQNTGSGNKYFYTFGRLDSAWDVSYLEDGSSRYYRTRVFTYDDSGHLIQENYKNFTICKTTFSYDDHGNLASTCSGCEGNDYCTVNEYNDADQLVKSTYTRPGGSEGVFEELFYDAGRLTEKHVTDYPIYGRFDMPVVTRIKYEY